MTAERIRSLVARLDTRNLTEQDEAWTELRPLGSSVVPFLAEAYETTGKARGRARLVYQALFYARERPEAFQLGIRALEDRARDVRTWACALLAYSLDKQAIPHLKALRNHPDETTRSDAHAALQAIHKHNHHLFKDREHTARVFWVVNPEDQPP